MRNWVRLGWPDEIYIGAASSIARVAEIIRLTTEEITKPHGVSQTRQELLSVLYMSRAGELPMGKIGSRLFIHPTSVTSAVDGLERLGYVERVPHPVDRRTTLVRITQAGRELVERTTPEVQATRYGLGALTEEEAAEIVRLLRKVRLAHGDFVAPLEHQHADGDHADRRG